MLRREPQQSRAPKRKGRNACRVPQQSGALSRGRGAQAPRSAARASAVGWVARRRGGKTDERGRCDSGYFASAVSIALASNQPARARTTPSAPTARPTLGARPSAIHAASSIVSTSTVVPFAKVSA